MLYMRYRRQYRELNDGKMSLERPDVDEVEALAGRVYDVNCHGGPELPEAIHIRNTGANERREFLYAERREARYFRRCKTTSESAQHLRKRRVGILLRFRSVVQAFPAPNVTVVKNTWKGLVRLGTWLYSPISSSACGWSASASETG